MKYCPRQAGFWDSELKGGGGILQPLVCFSVRLAVRTEGDKAVVLTGGGE